MKPKKKQRGGERDGAGRPRTDAPRCPCGKMTAKRAAHQSHKCIAVYFPRPAGS